MRYSRSPLRGSVTQNTMRMRGRDSLWSSLGFRLSALASTLLLALAFVAWLWHIGWPQQAAHHIANAGLDLTQKANYAVKDIIVDGRQQTSRDAISDALDTGTGMPILGFDPKAAQARIAKLPWVASVTVERQLPSTILVHLTERIPLARWQHDNRTVVIDSKGQPLPEAKLEQFADLPLVVGADAPAETQDLLDRLKEHPAIQRVTTAAVRVSERRWDLHLEPKVIARLPEKDIDDALTRLEQLIVDKKILERNVAAIDLRMPDRLILEPIPGSHSQPTGGEKL